MTILKVGQTAQCECRGCGERKIIIGEFASKCQDCGASVNPFTGEVLVSGAAFTNMGFIAK